MNAGKVNRRAVLRGLAVMGEVIATPAMASSRAAGARIHDLRVDHLVAPLAIEGACPRLSWQVEGFRQTAYRITVGTKRTMPSADRGNLWDSGRVADGATFDIAYAGRALRSTERAYWRVEAWDDEGRRFTSDVEAWQAGLLAREDWQGEWLAAESVAIAGDREAGLHWIWSNDPVTLNVQVFSRRVSIPKDIPDAVLQVVARDEIEGIWLNGSALDRPNFRSKVVNNARMETIRLPVVPGDNLLVVAARYRPDRVPKSQCGGMAAVIRLTYGSGHVERLTTLNGWSVADRGAIDGGAVSASLPNALPAASRPLHDPWAAGPAMLLRKAFVARPGIVRATLYATALGAYRLELNGRQVGDAVLAPESTDFSRRVQYQAYDVTAMLGAGANMLGAIVGDGWYGSTALFGGRFDFGPAPCRFLAHLAIEYNDGSCQTVVTDRDWWTAPSPVLASELYDGEVYDARRAIAGWSMPGPSDADWTPARVASAPEIAVTAQVHPPIRVARTLRPISIRAIRPGVHVVDFGQNFAGWCRLSASAPAGTTITLRHGELLSRTGEVDQSNLRSAMARDTYIFAGTGREDYRPHFTYHGFRYVQVEGWNELLPPNFLTGEAISTDLTETGLFHIDSPLIQKLWLNTLWSQRSNFVGVPTDCPQRDERLGWMGDAQIFWDAASFNMDVSAFTRRFMRDARDGQSPDGAFAEFNPQSRLAQMKGAPGWADAGILLPWTTWRRYGDTAIIDENWQSMMRYADCVMNSNPDFLWRNARGTDYGDWLALDAKEPGDPTTPKELIATAYWYRATVALADMAGATSRTQSARRLRMRAGRIAGAFRNAFVAPDGQVGNGSQTGYLLALKFGLIPPQLRGSAGAHLVGDIIRRGTMLSTGFLGTPIALDVLLDLGERNLVRALLERTDYPSWGYMVRHGATTVWERWNGDMGDIAMNSFNHYALGAIVGFFYRRLAGIDAARPGFSSVLIAPDMWLGFGQVRASYASQSGRIETAWMRRGREAHLDVAIPDNATGLLRLPAGPSHTATLGGRPLSRRTNEYHATLPSGRHRIVVDG